MVTKVETTHIRVGKELKERLNKQRGDMSITKYLNGLVEIAMSQDKTLSLLLKDDFTLNDVKVSIDALRRSFDSRLEGLKNSIDMLKMAMKHEALKTEADIYGIHMVLKKLDPSEELLKSALKESAGYEWDNREKFGLKPIEHEFKPPEDYKGKDTQ